MYPKKYRKVLEKRIQNYAKVNVLSPAQIDRLLKLDYDATFLVDKVKECLENPDIQYLESLFLPPKKPFWYKNRPAYYVNLSVAAGDIIGSAYEFTEHKYDEIDSENLVKEYSRFTDDSVLSFATRSAILKNKANPDFRTEYIEAYKKYPDAGFGSGFIRWAIGKEISNEVGYGSFADGSAMRIANIGVMYDDVRDVIKQTIRSASVTHNHQDGIKGAVVIAVCIWMLKNGYSKKDVEKYTKRFYYHSKKDIEYLAHSNTYFDMETPLKSVSNAISKNSMFCNHAVPFAIKCFLETDSFKECMCEVLKHFGDTDTICAIAGGLSGAYYGEIDLSEQDMERIDKIIAPLQDSF